MLRGRRGSLLSVAVLVFLSAAVWCCWPQSAHRCENKAVRAVLSGLAKASGCTHDLIRLLVMVRACLWQDEARHAVLAWRTLRWALQSAAGSSVEEAAAVREGVAAAFERSLQSSPRGRQLSTSELEPYGRLPCTDELQLRAAAQRCVLRAWSGALLDGQALPAIEGGDAEAFSAFAAASAVCGSVWRALSKDGEEGIGS